MKHLKRLLSIALCFVITFSAVAGSVDAANYGIYSYYFQDKYHYESYKVTFNYPLCGSFMYRSNFDPNEWWNHYYPSSFGSDEQELKYYAGLWLNYYMFGDSEEICPEYLEAFGKLLTNAHVNEPPKEYSGGTQLYDYRVDGCTWLDNRVTVQCSTDFDITYYCTYDWMYNEYDIDVVGNLYANLYLVFTNKSDGSLVHLGKIRNCKLVPYEEFGSAGYRYYEEPEYPVPEKLKEIERTGEGYNYKTSSTASFEVYMPNFYDPSLHDVMVCFAPYDARYTDYVRTNWPVFYNPTVLTRDDVPEPPVSSETEPVEPPVSSETEPVEPPVSSETEPVEPPVSSETEPVEPPVSSETEPVEPPVSSEIVTPEPPVPDIVRGDADGSGALNLLDVTLTLKYLAEWEGITLDEIAADISGNGDVTLSDVSLMLQIIAGWNV